MPVCGRGSGRQDNAVVSIENLIERISVFSTGTQRLPRVVTVVFLAIEARGGLYSELRVLLSCGAVHGAMEEAVEEAVRGIAAIEQFTRSSQVHPPTLRFLCNR